MANPTIRQVVTATASAAAATATTGVGTAVNDELVVFAGNDWYTAITGAPTGSAGTWTLQATGDNGTNNAHIKIWTRPVTVGGSNTVTVTPTSDEEVYITAYVLIGADNVTPNDGAAVASNGASATAQVAPAVSPSTTDALLLCGVQTASGAPTYTPPSGMTEQSDFHDVFCSQSTASQVLSASGSTGTKTFTASTAAPWATASIAIKGASGGGATVAAPLPMMFAPGMFRGPRSRAQPWMGSETDPTVGAVVVQTADVALVAAATLTANGTPELAGAVSLSVGSTLSSQPFLTEVAAVSLPATSTLSAAGTLTAQGAVSLTATSSLTSTPAPIAGAVSLTTAQSLTATGAVSQPASTTLTATSTLSVGGFQTEIAAVSLAASPALSVTGRLDAFAATTLAATSTLSVAGIRTTSGAVTLTAAPTLSAAAFLTLPAAVSLAASPALTVSGGLGAFGAVALSATPTLTVTVGAVGASASLTTAQSLTVAGQLLAFSAVSLSAVSTLSSIGLRSTDGSVTLSVVPVLTSGVTVRITTGAASLTALCTLTSDGIRIANVGVGGVPLVAVGTLSVNGSTGSGGASNLGVTSTLLVSAVRVVLGATQLTALSSLSVGGIAVEFAAVSLTATGVLSAAGVIVKPGAVSLVISSALLSTAAIRLAGAAQLIATANLLLIELFPEVDFSLADEWVTGGIHRDRERVVRPGSGWDAEGIHTDPRQRPQPAGSDWTTAGIHAG